MAAFALDNMSGGGADTPAAAPTPAGTQRPTGPPGAAAAGAASAPIPHAGTASDMRAEVKDIPWMKRVHDAPPPLLAELNRGRHLLFRHSNVEQALAAFNAAMQIAQGVGREDWAAYPLSQLVLCYERGGNVPAALNCLKQALVLSEKSGNPLLQAYLLTDAARLHAQSGNAAEYRNVLETQLRMAKCQSVGCPREIFYHAALNLWGALLRPPQPRRAESLKVLQEILEKAKADNLPLYVEAALEGLGNVYTHAGPEAGDEVRAVQAVMEAAHVAHARGDKGAELRHLTTALVNLLRKKGEAGTYWRVRARIERLEGKTPSAAAAVNDCDDAMRKREAAAVCTLAAALSSSLPTV